MQQGRVLEQLLEHLQARRLRLLVQRAPRLDQLVALGEVRVARRLRVELRRGQLLLREGDALAERVRRRAPC